MIELACPECAGHFMTEDRFSGRTATCPTCRTKLKIPLGQSPAATPEQPKAAVERVAAADPIPASARKTFPGKLRTAGLLSLIGGIWAVLWALGAIMSTFMFGLATLGFGMVVGIFMIPLSLYGLTMGILAIVNGSFVLTERTRGLGFPKTVSILQMVNILNCDVVNLALGIISLVSLTDPQVKAHFSGNDR